MRVQKWLVMIGVPALAISAVVAVAVVLLLEPVVTQGTTNFDTVVLSEDLLVGDDATVSGDLSVSGNASVSGSLVANSGVVLSVNRYALATTANGYAVYCGSATVTGTLEITGHGLTTPTVGIASLGSNPGVTAGDPFLVSVSISGSSVTLKVWQDDATAATKAATVYYCVYGQ